MIKANLPAPAAVVTQPAPVARENDTGGAVRDGDSYGFAIVLDALGIRPEADASCGVARASSRGSRDQDEAVPLPEATAGESSRVAAPVLDTALATADATLAMFTPQPGSHNAESPAGAAIDLAALLCVAHQGQAAAPVANPAPMTVQVEALAARVLPARAPPDGELQARLALAASAIAAPAATVLVRAEGAIGSRRDEPGALDATSANPQAIGADARVGLRSTGTEVATAPPRPPELRSPPGAPAWADELGARVTWMLDRGEQVASLRLSPENLGPLEVRIAVREGETTVWFGASQAETRAALEQSLPRLKEMLGASGLSLANAGVFSESPRDPQRGFTAAALARAARESGADPAGDIVTTVTRRGLVDLYA